MNMKEIYTGTTISLRGRCAALTTGITNVCEFSALLRYSNLSTQYLVHPVSIVSSLAADALASTGARKVEICGLNEKLEFDSEILTMNGQNIVVSTKYWYRLFSAEVVESGTGETNAGVIIVWKSGIGTAPSGVPDATALAAGWVRMLAGHGFATSGVYTVPKNTTVEARHIMMSARTQISDLYIVSQEMGVKEIQTLTITDKPTGNGDITVTLNSVVSGNIAVTTDDTIATVVQKIAAVKFYGWTATTTDTEVVFTSTIGIDRTLTFAITPNATGVTGAFVETLAGTRKPYKTELAIGTANNALSMPLPMENEFKWTEGTDIYLRGLSTSSGGVVSVNILMRNLSKFS